MTDVAGILFTAGTPSRKGWSVQALGVITTLSKKKANFNTEYAIKAQRRSRVLALPFL